MHNRVIASILSILYCGLGQIYKGSILKGLNYVILYTGLIISFLFFPLTTSLRYINISMLVFLWFVNVMDALFNDESNFKVRYWLIQNFINPTLSFIAVIGSIGVICLVTLWSDLPPSNIGSQIQTLRADFALQTQKDLALVLNMAPVVQPKINNATLSELKQDSPNDSYMEFRNSVDLASNSTPVIQPKISNVNLTEAKRGSPENNSIKLRSSVNNDIKTKTPEKETMVIDENPLASVSSDSTVPYIGMEYSGSGPYFAIQIGAFSEQGKAESIKAQLIKRNYMAYIVPPNPDENNRLYKVRIGKFKNKYDAREFAKTMTRKTGIDNNMIVKGSS